MNSSEIRKAISILKPEVEGEKPEERLFEVRIIENSKKINYSGYFTDADTLVRELKKVDTKNANVYITLNQINAACYSRSQKDKFERNNPNTTSDNDIDGYNWFFVDIDPKRPSGVSSTDEQLEKAKAKANDVYFFLNNFGFNKPLIATSGNGVHLLYRVMLANNAENKELVKKCLEALDMLFSDNDTSIDRKNFNPARICKLYGTMARKGSNTEKNPHRMSFITQEGSSSFTDRGYLVKLSKMLPEEQKAKQYNNYSPSEFNLEEWLNKHHIGYRKTSWSSGTKYILDECPFDSSHKGKDACIFQSSNGAIGFHCFHNSCADHKWQDVRKLFEPDAYERKYEEYDRKIYDTSRKPVEKKPVLIEEKEGEPVFYTARQIFDLEEPEETFVKTGISQIDRKLRGLQKGCVSVMSGLRASGKSSVISQIVLQCREDENNVAVFSGELKPKKFLRWMLLQAAGKSFSEPTQFENYFNVPRKIQERIVNWFGSHFHLYNNKYGNDFEAIVQKFEDCIVKDKLDLLILDNLMAFNISSLSKDKYEAQSAFVWKLHNLAEKYNVHILFVAHPKKAQGFLRLEDISGTNDLVNAVDTAFIVHRVNEDFKRLSAQMFGWKQDHELYKANNVVEIAKDREGGVQDEFVPLWYEVESKRLKNYISENKQYGWTKDKDGFRYIDDEESPFC